LAPSVIHIYVFQILWTPVVSVFISYILSPRPNIGPRRTSLHRRNFQWTWV